MAYYDIYDGNDNLVASNVFIDETEVGGGGSGGGGIVVLLLWIAYLLSPFVLTYFCITTYFDGTDQLFFRICGALPMIITIIITGITVYWQIEHLVLKLITLKKHTIKRTQNPDADECDTNEASKKVWEKRLSKFNNFGARFLKIQKVVRYCLIFVMLGCIVISLLPLSFELNEETMLPLIGPLFAYSYFLCIAEYIIKLDTLGSGSWWIFVISLVGGTFAGYCIYSFLNTLEPPVPPVDQWYFSIKGLEIFIVLICILLGFELGLKLFGADERRRK